MKISIKGYFKPTPRKMRMIGDALLAVSTASVPAMLEGYKVIGIAIFVCCILGKFLTNFFSHENESNK